MTLAEIGEQIGMATSSVSDIAHGYTNEPGGNAALKLHQLHVDRCGPKAARKTA